MAEGGGYDFFALEILFFGFEDKRLAVPKIRHFHVTPLQNCALLLAFSDALISDREIDRAKPERR